MKKLISLLAAVSVVSACSLAAFATDYTVDYGNSNTSSMTVTDATTPTEYTEAEGVYTFDLSTVDGVANTQDQTTILAVKGNTISVGSIQYINQSSGKSFSFALKDELTEDVNVLVGGSSIQPTKVSTIEAPAVSTGYTVSGTVANAPSESFITDELTAYVEELYGADAVADYIAQYQITASLIAEDEFENFVLWTIGEADSFTALQTSTVSFEDGTYSFTEVENGTYAVALVADGAMTWVDYVTVEGENVTVNSVTLKYGDVITAKDAMIDPTDVALAVANMCDIESDIFNGTYDVNPDCMIDPTDIANIVSNMGDIYNYNTDFINDNF